MQERSFENIDLLFLDIQMPELDGMEFSKMLGDKVRIVFTTAFEQYALDSYKVNALDYLLKPIAYPDFLQAANKALQWYERIGQGPVEMCIRYRFRAIGCFCEERIETDSFCSVERVRTGGRGEMFGSKKLGK